MKRKDYQKPTMLVVKLQQRTMLMSGSNSKATLQDYTWNSDTNGDPVEE